MKFRISMISCLVLFGIGNATSAIVAFDAADPKFKPEILAGNGPNSIINIQAADSNGVSRNIYSEFNINNNESIIFNNGNTESSVILNGEDNKIAANPLLTNGTAQIILNEINSAQSSKISGGIEVAGDKADIIIANPSGIDVDGAFFFNANNITFAAGNTVFDETGNHTGYLVNGGVINLNNQLYTDENNINILAGSLNVNDANVNSESINIVLGNNEISRDLSTITPIESATGNADGLTARNGHFFSKNISIRSTNSGVGVNLNNSTLSSANRSSLVTIDANGLVRLDDKSSIKTGNNLGLTTAQLENAGTISSGSLLNINSRNVLQNSGRMTGDRVTIRSNGTVTNNNLIAADETLRIVAGDVNNNRELRTRSYHAQIYITAIRNDDNTAQGIINNNGEIVNDYYKHYGQTTNKIELLANTINNNRSINRAGNIKITVIDALNNNGRIKSDNNLNITAGNLTNGRNAIIEGILGPKEINIKVNQTFNNSGYIFANGTARIQAGEIINNLGSKIIGNNIILTATKNDTLQTTGNITNRGDIIAKFYSGELTLNSQALNNEGNIFSYEGNVNINAVTEVKNNGLINSQQRVTTVNAGDVLNQENGLIQGEKAVSITATKNELLGGQGSIINQGKLKADGYEYNRPCQYCYGTVYYAPLSLTGETVSNAGTMITSNLRVNAPEGNYTNTGTIIESTKTPYWRNPYQNWW